MELSFLRKILILHLLISLQVYCNRRIEATENNSIHEGHDPLSHIHHHQMDPSLIVFFLLDDLKEGTTMQIYFPKRNKFGTSSSTPLLTKEEADSIPFSSKHLPELLHRFAFSRGSPQSIAMENALRQCETKPIKGEIKFCATSVESMLDFAREIFRLETETSLVEALSTTHVTELRNTLQRYTITEVPEQILAPKTVACHTMPYPYMVFYCHYQESESRVYKVHLVATEHGDEVEAIAVCHMDTSQWSPNHVSFRLLGVEPGSSPVCHFFPTDNLVLVPGSSTQSIAVA